MLDIKTKLNQTFPNKKTEIESAFSLLQHAFLNLGPEKKEYYLANATRVAEFLLNLGLDYETIIVALLHNTTIIGNLSLKQIKLEFGENIENLLKLFNKIGAMKYDKTSISQDSENIRQMFVAVSKDIRVILIKFYERYFELLNLNLFTEQEQFEIASETMDIFVPLVERLGMNELRAEMEDICFKYLKPNEYAVLKADLDTKFKKRKLIMNQIDAHLNQTLNELKIHGVVTSRFKHLYSVYKKLNKAGTEKIYDIIAFRIIVDEIKDCYTILGQIHSIYKPVPGRIKDYIASPKPNGYQSLHTTLLTQDNIPFEVQIRTHKMHEFCEYGIAAHWRYKEGKSKIDNLEERMNWFKKTLESEKQIKDNDQFIDALKMNLSTGEIWVFTPKYKPISLPENSTPVDFAYSIHSGIGNKCVGAKVNDKIVPLNFILKTGDIVEIITSANSKGPSLDWLNFARSGAARQGIRSFIKKQSRETNIKSGKELLENEAKKFGFSLNEFLEENNAEDLAKRFNLPTVEDVFSSVGFGALTPKQFFGKYISERIAREKASKLSKKLDLGANQKNPRAINPSAVIVDGKTNLSVKFAQCCNPIPGDDIVGFSSSRGITIHKKSCPNAALIWHEKECSATWQNTADLKFYQPISFVAINTAPVLSQITPLLAKMKVNIASINSKFISSGESQVDLVVQVKSRQEFEQIINKIKLLDGVLSVR